MLCYSWLIEAENDFPLTKSLEKDFMKLLNWKQPSNVEDTILAALSGFIEFPAPLQYRNKFICSEVSVSEPPETASAHSVL